MKVVIVISASAEWMGLMPLFPLAHIEKFPYGECFTVKLDNIPITFFHTGWGKTASAGALQYILDHEKPDLMVNLGTCGGFAGVVNQGDIILVEQTFVY